MAWMLGFQYPRSRMPTKIFVGLHNIFVEHLFELYIDKSDSPINTILTAKGVYYGS